MAILNGDNYGANLDNFPPEKIAPSKINNEMGVLTEEITLAAELAVNDEVLGPFIPEGAKIIDAYVKIDSSTGAGGIVDLGYKAGLDRDGNAVGEDQNALVDQADAGGQAVLERADQDSAGIGLIVGKGGLQSFLKCTEATTTGTGVKVSYAISYIKL
jgi:hypothetical protein